MKGFKNIFLYYFIFLILMLYKLLGFNLMVNMNINIKTIFSALGFILLLFGFPMFFEKSIQVKILFLINILIAFILTVDLFYYDYYKSFFTLFSLRQVGLLGEVVNSLTYLFKVQYLILIADVLLSIFIITRKIGFDEEKFGDKAVKMFALILSGILILNINFYLARKKDKWVLTEMYDKRFIVENTSILGYHYFDFKKFANENNFIKIIDSAKAAEIKEFFNKKKNGEKPNYYGKYKGKNLIIVQLEAFQYFLIDKKINGVEVTPNLNKLAREEIYLSNFYYQISNGGTSDAEFAVNTSLLPLSNGAVYYLYPYNNYESIAKHLKDLGYFTSVMHGNDESFWNRPSMYKSLGFDKYESINDFTFEEKIGLGLADDSFFKQAVGKMKGYNKPFYSFLITLSSHYPYRDKKFEEFDVGNLKGSLLGNYLQSAHYVDRTLGDFVENLKKEGLWDNSVVIFYGDHHAIPYGNKEELERAIGEKINDDYDWTLNQRVVAIMHVPDFEIKGQIDKVCGQADLAPTIATLFGFELEKSLGKNIFSNEKGYVIFPDGSFIYDDYMYLQQKGEMVDKDTKNKVNEYYIIEMMKKMYDYSSLIIRNNL
ncbi:LTA synthase family protein [Caloramator australicus]|uniref:Lipoteichoic acid synthase LtaS Type IVa n=1 Tax=Caloramator australicus RC3 TaxID=857293 RepID=G0V481_9CLOT|nr:LTA synthase family protein [Caloramator australicus]CCC57921.1 Lipoteichoic acid synthase LtaS Type IVa [Caloramator australicus RC3]